MYSEKDQSACVVDSCTQIVRHWMNVLHHFRATLLSEGENAVALVLVRDSRSMKTIGVPAMLFLKYC